MYFLFFGVGGHIAICDLYHSHSWPNLCISCLRQHEKNVTIPGRAKQKGKVEMVATLQRQPSLKRECTVGLYLWRRKNGVASLLLKFHYLQFSSFYICNFEIFNWICFITSHTSDYIDRWVVTIDCWQNERSLNSYFCQQVDCRGYGEKTFHWLLPRSRNGGGLALPWVWQYVKGSTQLP